jgi:hypothetical protein
VCGGGGVGGWGGGGEVGTEVASGEDTRPSPVAGKDRGLTTCVSFWDSTVQDWKVRASGWDLLLVPAESAHHVPRS